MATTAPEPGIYEDIAAEDYFSWQAVNNSSLSYAARSMLHYRYAPEQQPTAAMWFGTLCHSGVLEPEALHARYEIIPDLINSRTGQPFGLTTQKYLDYIEENKAKYGREVATKTDFTNMLRMVQAIYSNDFARKYLCPRGKSEVCIVWDDPESGVRCKARCDKWDGISTICDLKTTQDASQFHKAIANYSYHRQAAFYADGMHALTGTPHSFAIVCIEKSEPYGCRGAFMGQAAMAQGRREYKRLLLQLAEARRSDVWPGYTDPEEWTLPAWAAEREPEPELTINGEFVVL